MGFLEDAAKLGSSVSSAISPWGAALGGISAIGSLFGGDSSKKIAREQMALQRELAAQNISLQRETNQMQKSMFDSNLAWQRESQDIQNSYNTEQWLRSFYMTNEYNSPASQMQRAIAAGLNPMSVGGANPALAGQNSSPSAGTGSSGSGIPSLVAPQYPSMQSESSLALQAQQGISQRMNAISSSLAALAQSGLSSATSQRTYKLMQAELDKVLNESANLEADEQGKLIANALNETFGYTDRDLAQQAVIQNIAESVARANMYKNQGELYMAEKYLADAKETLTQWDIKHSKKEYKYLEKYLSLRNQNIQSEIKLHGAQTSQANSMVSLNHTQEELNRSMSGYYSTMDAVYQVEKKLKDNEFTFNDYTQLFRIERYISECEEQGYITEQEKHNAMIAFENAKQAAFDTDHQAFAFYAGQIRQTLGTAADVISSIKGLSFAPANVNHGTPDFENRTITEPYKFQDAKGNKYQGTETRQYHTNKPRWRKR